MGYPRLNHATILAAGVRQCSRCRQEKAFAEFYKNRSKLGISPRCRACVKSAASEWVIANKAKRRAIVISWNRRNTEQKKKYNASRRLRLKSDDPEFSLKENERAKLWRRSNTEKATAALRRSAEKRAALRPDVDFLRRRRRRLKIQADPSKYFRAKLSSIIRHAIKRQAGIKSTKTAALLGCSVADFRVYIETRWEMGMDWGNWGRYPGCWQLDHIRPCASFDLTDPVQQRACFHFTNYQPLWMEDNVRKGAKWDGDFVCENFTELLTR